MLIVVLLILLVSPAWAGNTHGLPDEAQERQAWFGDAMQPYVVSGCLPTISGTTTLAAFACEAYVRGSSGDLVYVTQAAVAVGPLNQGPGTYWLAVHRDTSGTVSGWSRQSGTHYLWRLAATQPSEPAQGQIVAQVTVSGSTVSAVADYRRPASYVRAGVYDITDPLYGAVGDGTTDNQAAITRAIQAAAQGGTVQVPAGTFCVGAPLYVPWSRVTIQGASWAATLKACAPFAAAGNHGLVSVGYSAVSTPQPVSDVLVRSLTLDGASLAKPLEMVGVTRGQVVGMRLINSGPTHAALYVVDSLDMLIDGNSVSTAIGPYGDGIYCGGCTRPRITQNQVDTFTRIGIVTEDGTGKSSDVYIAGNSIRGAHNATAPEHNAGIWTENTCGVTILGNQIRNMTNTPGASATIGIMLSNGSGSTCEAAVSDNMVWGAQYGLQIATDPTDRVHVNGLHVQGVTAGTYRYGILISQARSIVLRNIHLGSQNYPTGTSGILIDLSSSSTPLDSLLIDSVWADPTATYVLGTATLRFFNAGPGLGTLTLRGCLHCTVSMSAEPDTLMIDQSTLSYRLDASGSQDYAIRARLYAYISNSLITRDTSAGANEHVFRPTPGASWRFQNVDFVDLLQTWDVDSATPVLVTFDNCRFLSSLQHAFAGTFVIRVTNSVFYNNVPWGALRCNGRNYPCDVYVANSNFVNSTAANTPVVSGAFAPTSVVLVNNQFGTTVQTNASGAIETLLVQPTTFANLGTRGNGSMKYCSDCTIANPCAGGGNGAMAKRLNGVWVCN